MAGKRRSKGLKVSKTAEGERMPVVANTAAMVLSIPELLSNVFSFSADTELAVSACVCKTWTDPALDELWRALDSIFPLLELVVDLSVFSMAREDPETLEVLSSELANANWSRFHFYAKRVRWFHFDDPQPYDGYSDMPLLPSGLIGTICLHHPYGPSLLPRLRTLGWSTSRSILSVIPFISENLMHLTLFLYDASNIQIQQTFGTLRNRKLKLETFVFSANAIGTTSEAALALWLKDMDTLEEIVLPHYYITARILNSMKTLPRLRIIRQLIDSKYQYNDTRMLGALPSGSFPSLVELTFTATPTAARHLLFNSATNFTCLTTLNLQATKDINTHQVLTFTQQLATHCPTITSIELALFLSAEFRDQGVSVLPVEILESLYPCKHLNDLRINHPLPLKLNAADVENMGHAWPEISHLCLCSDPNFSFPITEQMGNSLSILSLFALHLPDLTTLGLYFNGEDRATFGGYLYPRRQFTQLRSLIVGLSPVPKTHTRDLGFYLASLCSEPASVSWGIRGWMPKRMPPDTAECEKAWRDVGEVMAFAMRVKLAEEC